MLADPFTHLRAFPLLPHALNFPVHLSSAVPPPPPLPLDPV